MSLGVFISHSVGGVELPIVRRISASLSGAGVTPYLAMDDRQVGTKLTTKVQQHIEESDVLLALLTTKGTESDWVHDEIGFALGKGRKVLPFVEKGVDVGGMLAGVEYYEFDPESPQPAIDRVAHDLLIQSARKDMESATKETRDAATLVFIVLLVVLAIVLVVFLASSG